jgi:hypothetical protein
MGSYKIARRSFLRGVGGAVGFQAILRTLEAGAQGMKPPPRFLMAHWPVGTVAFNYLPAGIARGTFPTWTSSRILKPFEDAGLKGDLVAMFGFDTDGIGQGAGGGGHEGGTPLMSTGVRIPGTRAGEPEQDDFFAGGPSFDQVLLKLVPGLKTPGKGYANAICDSRVDLSEISTQCISYGYATQNVNQVLPTATTAIENVPLLPTLNPVELYSSLFSGFMPGGTTTGNIDKLRRALMARKRVLDFSLDEIKKVRTLAPSADRMRIDIHVQSIINAEDKLQAQINNTTGGTTTGAKCTLPMMPNPADVGQADNRVRRNGDYANPVARTADDALHERVGRAHMGILKAAFQCDIIRVATFQWSPGTNHVSFAGLFPNDAGIYMHHPTSHRITNRQEVLASPTTHAAEVEFLTAVHTWYNQKMASILSEWKDPVMGLDAYGGNVFDNTIIPYVTEVAETTHFPRNPIAALILGGKVLGMKGGQFVNYGVSGPFRPHNDIWFTIAQAYGLNINAAPLNAELIARATHQGPIAGLWAAPPA